MEQVEATRHSALCRLLMVVVVVVVRFPASLVLLVVLVVEVPQAALLLAAALELVGHPIKLGLVQLLSTATLVETDSLMK
jgi:hypothetical protein